MYHGKRNWRRWWWFYRRTLQGYRREERVLFEVDGSEAEICASNYNYEKHWVILNESHVVAVCDSEPVLKSKKRRASSSNDARKAKKQKTSKSKNAKTVETIVVEDSGEDSGEESDSGEDALLLPAVEI